jgi:hypothetical protein
MFGPSLLPSPNTRIARNVHCVPHQSNGLGMTIRESILSFFGRRGPDEMLKMEVNNLKFRFDRIDATAAASDAEKKRYVDLERSLAAVLAKPPETWAWDDAYHIEKQIAMLLSGDRLHQEISFRLREAVRRNAEDAPDLQTDYATLRKEKKGDEDLRNFLQEVLEANHWDSKLKYLKRKVRLKATRNTLLIFVSALVVVIGPHFFLGQAYISTTRFALYNALTFGLLGALFSRLYTIQSSRSQLNLEELHNAQRFLYIIQRACIGACGALIIYFVLQSELVTGRVFPDFKKLGSNGDHLARLIVLSFAAGFSESLVPSVLSKTERQMEIP